ncbi:SdpA family antimicrobial peptide system protein (plasmid) [Bacillus cereus]|nr:SdpA family antimicrobial peptide system protein [Bacillus cereus]
MKIIIIPLNLANFSTLIILDFTSGVYPANKKNIFLFQISIPSRPNRIKQANAIIIFNIVCTSYFKKGVNIMIRKDRKIFIFFVFTFVIYFTIFCLTILVAIPENPLSLSKNSSRLIKTIIPQGWGFYSKNPRDEMIFIYDMEKKEILSDWPNNKVKNLFGLSREGRGKGVEAGLLFSKIGTSKWTTCNKKPEECLENLDSVVVNNTTPYPSLCGDIGIGKQKPVPWIWGRNKNIEMPSKVVRVKSACSKK